MSVWIRARVLYSQLNHRYYFKLSPQHENVLNTNCCDRNHRYIGYGTEYCRFHLLPFGGTWELNVPKFKSYWDKTWSITYPRVFLPWCVLHCSEVGGGSNSKFQGSLQLWYGLVHGWDQNRSYWNASSKLENWQEERQSPMYIHFYIELAKLSSRAANVTVINNEEIVKLKY